MKKTLRSQLFVAIVMMVAATVALTSASYAWFTSIANPEVKTIDLYVKAADNLMLSAYANNVTPGINVSNDWKATIAQTDIKATAATGNWGAQATAFPIEMFNVSSLAHGANSGFFTAVHSTLGAIDSYIAAPQVVDNKGTNYAKFSLWVKSTNDGMLYLDGAGTPSSVVGIKDDPANAGTWIINEDVPGTFIKSTVRVAFVPVANSVEDWTKSVIWEPNSTSHLPQANGGPTGTGKLDTQAVTAASVAGGLTAQVTSDFAEGATKIDLFALIKDTATNFNVYIWVEGADADTVNAVAKNAFQTYLKFGQTKS